MKGKKVDLVVHNAQIHVLDDQNSVHEAMAISNGKIVEVGPERQILNKYRSDESIDAQGKDIYPGLTDAHGHLFSYAKQLLAVDLTGVKSMNEVVILCEKFASRNSSSFIVGRGWDQSLWNTKELPDYEAINKAFPTIPVCLYRVDGHAALVNKALLKKAKITATTVVEGGKVVVINGEPNGLLIDNAMQLVEKYLPVYSEKELAEKLIEIQGELLQYGIIGVHEAGVTQKELKCLEHMIDKGQLDLEVYAMLMPIQENFNFVRKKGIYRHKNLLVRSFKVFADGALGSRGALLKKPYADDVHNHGLLLTSVEKMSNVAKFCLDNHYQMNTHGIGDSANALILKIYENAFKRNSDHRFRIEHAQVIDPIDFKKFAEFAVFPSVQPTHAVSDQRWAEERLGKERLKGAYAYKTLLNQFGMLAIGTDFPVEKTNPFLTIHAAVQRKNEDNQSLDGFLKNESLTLDQVMRGMTIWAAFASFRENETGTLEKGKNASFVIFENQLESTPIFEQNFAWKTFIKGKLVYDAQSL